MTIDAEAREDLIDRLQEFPARIQNLITEADEADLKRAGPGGAWGAVEILCHLRDLEELYLERLIAMLEEDGAELEVVEDSLWPIARDYLNQDPLEAFDDFVNYRRQVIDLLDEADNSDWARTGRHAKLGQMTIRDYTEWVVNRDREHEQMLRAALNQEED